jgi:hypothetical protein
LLLEEIEVHVTRSGSGVWRRFLWPTGELFEEYRSDRTLFGLPLLHYTRGRSPETGRGSTARGFVAVGRRAIGVVAIGQGAAGIVAVGQASVALLLAIDQAALAPVAIGQLAVGLLFGLGQAATGIVAIGQLAAGKYVLAQIGLGHSIWDTRGADPVAQEFFRALLGRLRG